MAAKQFVNILISSKGTNKVAVVVRPSYVFIEAGPAPEHNNIIIPAGLHLTVYALMLRTYLPRVYFTKL